MNSLNLYKSIFLVVCILNILFCFETTHARVRSSSEAPGFFSDVASPVATDAWTPVSIGLLLTGTLLIFEDSLIETTQTEVTEDKPLGWTSKYGDLAGQGVPNILYAGGALMVGYFGDDDIAYRQARHMALATIYSGVMAQILKNIVREPRPNDKNDRAAFPSGHTTTAFAFASVVGAQHGWGWGIPAYALATFVGYSRMNDNKHYLHDVVAGATLGIGYGLGLYYNMIARGESPTSFVDFIYLKPSIEGGQSLVAGHYF